MSVNKAEQQTNSCDNYDVVCHGHFVLQCHYALVFLGLVVVPYLLLYYDCLALV